MEDLLTDEERFNLGFATSYYSMNAKLGVYMQGVNDGAKAQYTKLRNLGWMSPEGVEAKIAEARQEERETYD